VKSNQGNLTPYGYSINNSEADLSDGNELVAEKMSRVNPPGHDCVMVGQHPQTRIGIHFPG